MGKVINTTSGNLSKYKDKQLREIKNLVVDTATTIEIEATRDAPRGEHDSDVFINIDKTIRKGGLEAEVGVMGENPLAAYFEFGTGLSARKILAPYPQWIRDIAWQFYVNGLGTLKGKPYFYPSVLKNEPIFDKELEKLIKEKEKDE